MIKEKQMKTNNDRVFKNFQYVHLFLVQVCLFILLNKWISSQNTIVILCNFIMKCTEIMLIENSPTITIFLLMDSAHIIWA